MTRLSGRRASTRSSLARRVFRERLDTFYSGNNGAAGTMTFNGQFTAGPTITQKATSAAGLAEADFFLGLPSAVGVGTNGGTWGQRGNIHRGFRPGYLAR